VRPNPISVHAHHIVHHHTLDRFSSIYDLQGEPTPGDKALLSPLLPFRMHQRRLGLGQSEGHFHVTIEGNANLFWLLS
jgi:hypothetical protein